jgi:hypothetical protein
MKYVIPIKNRNDGGNESMNCRTSAILSLIKEGSSI